MKKQKKRARVRRSKKKLRYHGREGYTLIHTSQVGKQFIMVRKRKGGTKRLYLKNGNVPQHLRG